MIKTTVLLCIAGLSLPAALRAQNEKVSPLPAPTGTSGVGTTVAYLVDVARRDADFPNGRPVNLQLWYPANQSGKPLAPYLAEPTLGAALVANQYYGMDSATIGAWSRMVTHSHLDAAPANGQHPLIAFSVGQGVARAHYTSIAEELASHGYIVAMVESPLQGFMVDGKGKPVIDTAGVFGNPADHRRGVNAWSDDIGFVIDRLAENQPTPVVAAVARTINWKQLGAVGHSSGGIVALATCERNPKFRACIDIDGGLVAPTKEPLADFVPNGTTKPALLLREQPLYDDSVFVRRGTTREAWAKGGMAAKAALLEFRQRAKAPFDVIFVAGTGHFSFSDAPFVMPSAITRFGGRIIKPERGWMVITQTIRAYLDQEIRGRQGALDALVRSTPELSRTAKD